MIQKDAYALICLKNNGETEVIYPKYKYEETRKDGLIFVTTQLGTSSCSNPINKDKYMFDMRDVQDFLKGLAGKFERIIITKVKDVVEVEIKSFYQDEND